MSCENEIHKGDIGTVFEVELEDCVGIMDISLATDMYIIFFKSESETSVVKDAVFTTDGTDGKIQYVTIADDLDETELWQIQGRVVLPTGTWSSETGSFTVFPNLDDA